MKGYSTREVAELLHMPEGRVRSFARAGILQPDRGRRSEYRFSFQDIVLLRAAKALDDARVPSKKVWKALRSLQEQLPAGRSLATVRISAAGDDVVVRDSSHAWEPYTGQAVMEFDVADLAQEAEPMVRHAAREARDNAEPKDDADDWYQMGVDLETVGAFGRAADAYSRALQIDASHAEAMINLGRLQHDKGELPEAEKLYRSVLQSDPKNVLALFNLGVVLDDQGLGQQAREAYEQALEVEPDFADAHFNLARLHERDGHSAHALRHLARYRALKKQGTQ
ncbi:MAG: tetratricopeptide repeat protein [Gammaproteobacteria bacterium]|nr:tetratricopeptide repeat protein [Gammaproteobacteria bacterium]NNF61579.1 tetratricopeptide repeat protein [Gammaproteobacteria bacterium]